MIFLLFVVLSSGQLQSGEALSRELGWALLAIYGVPYILCVAPALVFATLDRWLPLALILCFMVVPIILVILHYA
jgi:hypothetical protein